MIKKLNINLYWPKILSIIFFVVLLVSYVRIFALAPIDEPYQPGNTLDPICPPGEQFCTVDISGGAMTYPTPGIANSNGSAWGTSIANNSANWNTAYGWGNHSSAGYVSGTPWTSLGYISDGNTNWDNSYGFITTYTETDPNVFAWAKLSTKPTYTATEVGLGNVPNLSYSGSNTGDETNATIKTKLGAASTSTDGYLSTTDWNTFANKQNSLGFTPYNSTNPSNFISDGNTGWDNSYGFLTSYTETDPTISAWAKSATKPAYTATEVGAPTGSGNSTGTNTGDNSANNTYASDYRAANFVAGTNYLAPNGSAASLTSFPTLNQSTTGNALTATNLTGLTATIANLNTLTSGLGTNAFTSTAYLPSASFTDAGVTSKLITGYTPGSGALVVGDTILQAISKLSGNIAANGNGTVTSVSTAAANNGVTATWSMATPTPALTIGLGAITPTSVNGLTLTELATGFTVSGGTTSKILTVPFDASVSGTNTGDETNATIKTKLGAASTGVDGYLSGTDWNTFNNKISMVYPGNGIPNSTGSAWGTSYTTSGSGSVIALATSPVFITPTLGIATATSINNLPLSQDNNDFNIKIGQNAGLYIKAGVKYNTFIGYEAGKSDLLGATYAAEDNTAIGFKSLFSNLSGFKNTAIGSNSLHSNTTGWQNTSIGAYSLFANISGNYNTALGFYSLNLNTTGSSNTAIGNSSLSANTTGYDNTANGMYSLGINSTGYQNTANGSSSLYSNETGYNNTASGFFSLGSNTTGALNTASGINSLFSNTTGISNTANGAESLRSNIDGSSNTAIGFNSLNSNTVGNYNTAIGDYSLSFNVSGSLNTASGHNSLYSNTTGSSNTASGYNSLYSNSAGNGAVAYGAGSMRYINNSTTAWANNSTAIGYEALRGSVTAANNTGNYNTAIGYQSLLSNTTGSYNTAVGQSSLSSNTTGSSNQAIGWQALFLNTTGRSNISIGLNSMRANYSGNDNMATGNYSLYANTTGYSNTAYGGSSLYSNTTGYNNSALGYQAGYSISSGLLENRTSNNSLYLGHDTRAFVDGSTNEIVVGANAIGKGSNSAVWGNTTILNHYLNGSVQLSTYGAGTLTTDAVGNITASSDEKLKDIQAPFDNNQNALETILSLNPISYKWNDLSGYDQTTTYVGFSAQNVKEFIPDAVGVDPRGYLTLSDRPILATVVNAIKEMNLKIEDFKSLDISNNNSLGYLVKNFIEDSTNLFEKIFVKTVVTEGIEMKDSATGEYYCVVITNGEFNKIVGKCGEETITPILNEAGSMTQVLPVILEQSATSEPVLIESPTSFATGEPSL